MVKEKRRGINKSQTKIKCRPHCKQGSSLDTYNVSEDSFSFSLGKEFSYSLEQTLLNQTLYKGFFMDTDDQAWQNPPPLFEKELEQTK